MYERPQGVTITADTIGDLDFETNGGYKCFSPDEYKTIANIIVDYRWFWFYAMKRDIIIGKLELQIEKYEKQVGLWQTMSNNQQNSLNFTQTLVSEQNKIRLNQNRSQKIILISSIGLSIFEAIVIGALVFK